MMMVMMLMAGCIGHWGVGGLILILTGMTFVVCVCLFLLFL
jgi:hypothetical protein